MSNHEEYFYRTLYTIILESPEGGQRMNFFNDECKAREDAEELLKAIKTWDKPGFKVYLSYLDYSPRLNRIMSEDLITDDSELLYEN